MVQRQPDCLLPLKAVKQRRVRLHRKVGNLQRDLPSIPQIRSPIDRGHAALGYRFVNAEMVQLLAGFKQFRETHGSLSCPDVLAFLADLHGRSTDVVRV